MNKKKDNKFAEGWREYLKTLTLVLKGLNNDNISLLASGLVYSTLVALIPCLTFLLSFLIPLGGMQQFFAITEDWMLSTFGPDMAVQIVSEIERYSSNAMSLGVLGLLSFVVTGILLVDKTYMVINQIFRTKPENGTIKRLFTFLVFLIVVCFLIAFAVSLSGSIVYKIKELLGTGKNYSTMVLVARRIASSFVTWFVFFFILFSVPNVKVKKGSAALGATTGFIAFTLLNYSFQFVISQMISYWTIYGTLASVLFVLLYLYIFWFIIIAVAEISYIHQFRPDRNSLLGKPRAPHVYIGEAVNIVLYIYKKFSDGKGAATSKEIAKSLRITGANLNEYINEFESCGYIIKALDNGISYLPAKPADKVSVKDIISMLYGVEGTLSDNMETIGEAVSLELYKSGEKGFCSLTIDNLLERL